LIGLLIDYETYFLIRLVLRLIGWLINYNKLFL